MFDWHIDSTYWIIKFMIFTLYTHCMNFLEKCIIVLIFFLFTYVNTWNFLKSTWKYQESTWKWNLVGHPAQIKLKLFCIKNIKEFQLKCGVCDLYSYPEMLINTDMLAFRFWLKYISSLFKWISKIHIHKKAHSHVWYNFYQLTAL